MTETRKVSPDHERADVLTQPNLGVPAGVAQLEMELEAVKSALLSEQLRNQELMAQLSARDTSGDTKSTSTQSQTKDSFNIVMELSSEREAALRERKLYKERAENAEAQIADLESDLSAAHATAKVQAERANQLTARYDELHKTEMALRAEIAALKAKTQPDRSTTDSAEQHTAAGSDSIESLKKLLEQRDSRIAELEMQLVDRAGTPTLFGGELERLTGGMFPKAVYVLESLDHPGQVHKLVRPTNSIGRSQDNDIAIEETSVSRFHARLQYKSDGVWLADLHSVNGCQVNGRRTTGQLLNDGDLVTIGHCRFRFSALTS